MDNRTIFKTRQITNDLINQVLTIWKQGESGEALEGFESDPVFRLLMTALAFQSEEIDRDISRFKNELIEDFSEMIVPYNQCRAVPATTIVKTEVEGNYSEIFVNSQQYFSIVGSNVRFVPMFNTRVIKARVSSVSRMDGRRWKVTLDLSSGVSSLKGVSFCIKDRDFEDLSVSLNERPLALTKPWDYAGLPWSECFPVSSMIYNKNETYETSVAWFDFFAKQNAKVFYIGDYLGGGGVALSGSNRIDLVFEFFGIKSDFQLSQKDVFFNCVPLANVEVKTADVSPETPIVRVAGDTLSSNDDIKRQFLHLLPVSSDALSECPVAVRKIAADRFNGFNLLKLTSNIVSTFTSDFYAYQSVSSVTDGNKIAKLHSLLKEIVKDIKDSVGKRAPGVYIMLKRGQKENDLGGNYAVSYLITGGASVNSHLSSNVSFTTPVGLSPSRTTQIINPVLGRDEVLDGNAKQAISDYYLITHDRLVTPADIQVFCYKELFVNYGVSTNMVREIRVGHRPLVSSTHCGYEINVDITLINNSYVQKVFEGKMQRTAILLQKEIEVRTAGIYPIAVSFKLG